MPEPQPALKCPKCAATHEPGALACGYCGAVIASAESLGGGARSLDARFDELAASTARLLAEQRLPAVTLKSAHVAFGAMGANVARMKAVLDASARAIPRPSSPQECLVWLRRAPALVWVSYGALGHTRNFAVGHLYEVLAELFRERAAWEERDKGLRAAFAQAEPVARAAAPTVVLGVRRFARTNPLLALLALLITVGVLWSVARASPRYHHRARRSRHHAALVVPRGFDGVALIPTRDAADRVTAPVEGRPRPRRSSTCGRPRGRSPVDLARAETRGRTSPPGTG